jgi:tryptophan synthase alpha subunit
LLYLSVFPKHITDRGVCSSLGDQLVTKNLSVFQVAKWGADGVIVGSAMVKILGEAATPKEGLVSLGKFARELKAALP